MINPFQEIDWKPDVAAIRKFGMSLTIGATILLFAFFWLWVFADSSRRFCEVFASVFVVVLFIGLVVTMLPKASRPIYLVWYFLGACVGTVISNTILIAFYYCFFSVIAVVSVWPGVTRCSSSGRGPILCGKNISRKSWQDITDSISLDYSRDFVVPTLSL
jgi:hypothetical protein